MNMRDKAVAAMRAAPQRRAWSLEDLRNAAGVSLRSRYRLASQLMDDNRVVHTGSNHFRLPDEARHDQFMARVR